MTQPHPFPGGAHAAAELFISLLEPLKRPLLAYSSRSLPRSCDRDDALQTAVTTAFASFATFQVGTNFSAWMFKHLYHAIANHRRRNQRAVFLHADAGTDAHPAPTAEQLTVEMAYHHLLKNPDELYDQFDEHVAAALRALSDDERSILLLRALGALTYREIADIRAIPLGTVMSHLSRARQKMRERLTLSARSVRNARTPSALERQPSEGESP